MSVCNRTVFEILMFQAHIGRYYIYVNKQSHVQGSQCGKFHSPHDGPCQQEKIRYT